MHAGDAAGDDPTVLAVPDYRGSNPYQAELAAGLEREGVAVETSSGDGLLFPVTRTLVAAGTPPVLHVHFLAPYMVVGDDRLERLGLAGPLSALLGLHLVVDLLVASLLTDRLVWTAHDLRNHDGRAVRTERFLKHVFVRFLCDAVVVHCDRAKDVLRETFGLPERTRGKMVTVPHGHFLDEYPDEVDRQTARDRLDLPLEATVLLFFGWIRRYKNVPALVETFGDIDDEDVRLVVAGKPQTEELARAVETAARGDDRVTTTLGFVPDDEVATYMRAADVVALPFETDDQTLLTSGSVLLAMGFGRAVVAPRLGCVGELLTGGRRAAWDGGTVRSTGSGSGRGGASVSLTAGGVVYESTDDLEAALRTALDADLDDCGTRNRAYTEGLTWDRIAARTAAVYRGETV
jgi:glycosyltransferase involved in cell wall biosynthesis